MSTIQRTTSTDATQEVQRAGVDNPARPSAGDAASRTVRRAAVLAGVSLLVMAALAPFGNLVAVGGLVTPDDAVATTADLRASLPLFIAGVATIMVVIGLDVVVAVALYRVLAPVHRIGSLLAAGLRLAYSAAYLVAAAQLVGALGALQALGAEPPTAAQEARVMSGVTAYADLWEAGLALFGLHLVLVGLLVVRARYVGTWLGVLLVAAGAGYVLDTVVAVVSPTSTVSVSAFTFVGELLLAIWLVARGRRLVVDDPVRGGSRT